MNISENHFLVNQLYAELNVDGRISKKGLKIALLGINQVYNESLMKSNDVRIQFSSEKIMLEKFFKRYAKLFYNKSQNEFRKTQSVIKTVSADPFFFQNHGPKSLKELSHTSMKQ